MKVDHGRQLKFEKVRLVFMLEVTIPGEDRTEENSVNKRTRSW